MAESERAKSGFAYDGRGRVALAWAVALAEGGPGLAGPTGARAKGRLGRRELDKPSGLALNGRMSSIGSAENGGAGRSLEALKRRLKAMEQRCSDLAGELGTQEQEFGERKMSGAASRRAFARYEALRDRSWAAETRRGQLRGLIAERSNAGEDLP